MKGICSPKGFTASGVVANIKSKKKHKRDVAIIYSTVPAIAAGVFTKNLVKAAPVVITENLLKQKPFLQAIVVNSGNANACTGEQGMRDAKEMCLLTAQNLLISEELVAVASTGVIGVCLPMLRIQKGIALAACHLSQDHHLEAAEAIMTTDTFSKEFSLSTSIGGETITFGGMAKGSGMVHPNMATILGFVTTDAHITSEGLTKALQMANEASFNMISVDGDTSTNDMVLILANGLAGNPLITYPSPAFDHFLKALQEMLTTLAKSVARDGEGANKLLEVRINGAATEIEARQAARTISSSSLVKTAFFGCDANWGRILCALGYSGASFDPMRVDLSLGSILVMKGGTPVPFDEELATNYLSQKEAVISVDLHAGGASAIAWGCDLSYDYVKINGAYRT